MTVATLTTAMSAENRKAVIAGTIGNVLEWYDFGVYGYFATTISQLFFPGDDKTISLLKAFAVFGVGFIMRPVGSVLFGIYGDRFGGRLALSAVIFLPFSPEAFISWGWRVPFLLGILVGILGAYLRWRLSDTPKFTEIEQHGELAESPLIETFTRYRREALTIFGLTLHNTVAYYIPIIYMTSYIVSIAKLAPSSALWIGTGCLLVFVILIPIWGSLSDRIGRKPLLLLSSGGYIILAYPLFMMASSGSATLALIAQMVMIVFLSFFSGACPAAYSEILPTRVRYTALSIGYNIAVAVFGGFAPFIATWLIGVTGSNLAPSYYLIAAATITFLVVLRIPETAFEPLR